VEKIMDELGHNDFSPSSRVTMKDWFFVKFGQTLSNLFFIPFHEAYTAGLYNQISVQDEQKTPLDRKRMFLGAFQDTGAAGYNVKFRYPIDGLDRLIRGLSRKCRIHYNARVVKIELSDKRIFFDNGTTVRYDVLISTLPLRRTVELCDVRLNMQSDPYTSVLVLNIAAKRGVSCPDVHWMYVVGSKARFHRVGFYSNVDKSFLPIGCSDQVTLYVEKAYVGGYLPGQGEIEEFIKMATRELQSWAFIEEIDVVDVSWIDYAYTWAWLNSDWKQRAIKMLESHEIFPAGRYARWVFQGIADSIRDGLIAGASLR